MYETVLGTVRRTYKVKLVEAKNLRQYRKIIGSWGNLSTVIKAHEEFEGNVTVETEHGILTIPSSQQIKVEDGELFTPDSGAYVTSFLRDILEVRKTADHDIEAVFNGILFTVRADYTFETICDTLDANKAAVHSGEMPAYDF